MANREPRHEASHILITFAFVSSMLFCCAGHGQQRGGNQTAPAPGQTPAKNQVFTSKMYGIRFSYPSSYNFEPGHNTSYWHSDTTDFAYQGDAVVLGTVEIPSSLYPGTNFEGGKGVVAVSRKITNSTGCNQFASGAPSSTVSVNGIAYSVSETSGAGLGHYAHYDIFHTFQNGFCYEFMFEINTLNMANFENSSSVREFADTKKIEESLLSATSFFHPTAKPHKAETIGSLKVLSFSASRHVGDTLSGFIKFSWTTRNVDYVRLQYSCVEGGSIDGSGVSQQCGSYSSAPTQPPNGSTDVAFLNGLTYLPERPSITFTVTVVPFANGIPHPNLGKSVNVTVSPDNLFPFGVPTSNENMKLTLSPASNGEFRFARGSTVNIQWVDNDPPPPDICIDLHLVRDNGQGAENYIYTLSQHCLTPSRSGSYHWTIPDNFSGIGFRILGTSVGRRAHALSAPFTIY